MKNETIGGVGGTQAALLRLLLRNKSGLTIEQIGDNLDITRTAVTQHLNALMRYGYVSREMTVATGGRPGAVFALTERGTQLFPKKYDVISLKALEALIEAVGEEKATVFLEKVGRGLGQSLGKTLDALSLDDRVPEIAEAMEEFGFDAHVARDALNAVPEIKAYNCIYHSLAQARPEICALDLAFLREASGADIDHAACMAKGANECRFRFKRKVRSE